MIIRFKQIIPIMFFIVCIAVAVIKIGNINLTDIPYDCFIYRKTGLYCAGCGGTRACVELLNGHLFASIKYHPAVVYICGIMLYSIICFVRSVIKGTMLVIKPWVFYGLIVIVIVQWILKDVLLIVWGYRLI